MATVSYKNASRVYDPKNDPAVNQLSLDIADGEFLVLVGPSGCGKSTALRMLAGLEPVDDGTILIDDVDVTNVEAQKRDIAMVFQNYALYPHMSVADNMSFSLKINKVPKKERDQKVKEAARLLDLTDYLDRKPKALSGGQRQRVAMGRAIVREPAVFLMDEPLSNLDAKLRVQTRTQIASLTRELRVTTVYVTHDQVEALTMGDRIAVLKDGLLQQVGSPRELFDTPQNVFVAGFLGSPAMNIGTFPVSGNSAQVGPAEVPLPSDTVDQLTEADGGTVILGFRPESLDVVPQGTANSIPIRVNIVEELGSDAYVYGNLAGGADDSSPVAVAENQVIIRVDPRRVPGKGEIIWVKIRGGELHLFHPSDGTRVQEI